MQESLIYKLKNFKTPKSAVKIVQSTNIIFLVGISGSGKNSILKALLKTGKYKFIISHTTRKPRKNKGIQEEDGVDYHFVDSKKIEQMLDNDEFFEAKIYSGNIYGTSVRELLKAHDSDLIAISDIEIQGVEEYMKISKNIKPIFILPPNFKTWQERLHKRYSDSEIDPTDMNRRLVTAKNELKEALTKKYYYFVVNEDLSQTIEEVQNIAEGEIKQIETEKYKEVANELLVNF